MRGFIAIKIRSSLSYGLYEILVKATVLALIITIPPIVGLFLIWHFSGRSIIIITLWTVFTVIWNIIVLTLFVKGKLK